VASLRDTETGYPITTIGWGNIGNDQWATEYLSGFNNGEAIKPEYHDSIKQFLNSISEGNGPLGLSNFKVPNISDLQDRYNLFDKTDKSSLAFARASISTTDKQALKGNPDILTSLPRFFSVEDLRQAVGSTASSANAREPDNVRSLMQARNLLEEELASLSELGMSDQEMQTMVYDIQHEIADIDARLARVQQQPVAQQQPAPQQQPASQTRQRSAVVARAYDVADLFIEFSDPMLTTPMQFRDLASALLNRGTARSTAQDIAAIGESLGDFVLRASDFNLSNLADVATVLRARADALEQQAPAMPESRMAQITREQADVMPYAELAAAVGDPARYDGIVARAMREIRINESNPLLHYEIHDLLKSIFLG
jgi:hypothetical protein